MRQMPAVPSRFSADGVSYGTTNVPGFPTAAAVGGSNPRCLVIDPATPTVKIVAQEDLDRHGGTTEMLIYGA
ncbi:MAG: hypothetical protein JO088_07950 [Acidobacteria bacterium]|nr:hypothetical protein [Acidobacteriota bacterium]MBV9067502.1 hypothetical protein [Acidobacteriota bacterium]